MPHVLQFAKDFASVAKDAGARWADDACYRLAASLAYYALFSIFPLLLLAVTTVGFVLGSHDSARHELLNFVASQSPEFRALLDKTLQSMQAHRTARGVGAVVGGVALLLGASSVFSELESSLNFIWRVKSAPAKGIGSFLRGALKSKALSFVIVVAAATALLAALAMTITLGAISGVTTRAAGAGKTLWELVDIAVSLASLAGLFAAIYRVVPQAKVQWNDVWGAAVLTSVLFSGLQLLLSWYLTHLGSYSAYGAVGGILGLLTWTYLASAVLFYGAEVGRVYAERFGSLTLGGQPRLALGCGERGGVARFSQSSKEMDLNEKKTKPVPVERDNGFNESHGYAPGHGGPSGPGDVASAPRPLPRAAKSVAPGAELSEHVAQNIETMAHLQTEAEGKVGRHQRIIEKVTASIAQPRTLNVIAGVVAFWVALNTLGASAGLPQLDPPPFQWLQGVLSLSALLVTTMVLTTQSRQGQRLSQRGNLELQVNLVAEQKIAKLISLLEELRRDLPSVRDRVDPVANAMAESVDHKAVLTVLEENIESEGAHD
jgi:membrane protein